MGMTLQFNRLTPATPESQACGIQTADGPHHRHRSRHGRDRR
jgi:hypothetical protein